MKELSLAEHYLDVGQPRRTLELLGSADSDALEHPDFWWLRAAAQYELDQYEQAVRTAAEGLQRDPHSPPLLYLMAISEAEQDHLAEAERAILAALELNPDAPLLLATYARIAARGGQLDKAERLLDEAALIDPEDLDVLRTRSFVAYLRGRDRESLKLGERVLSEDPEDSGAHRLRGAALLERGDVRQGRRSLERAIRDDPDDAALAEAVRGARAWTHPLLWPIYPIQRLGVAGSWVASIATIFGLRAAGLESAAGVAGILWLVIVAYSWTVAPLAERWLMRRGRI